MMTSRETVTDEQIILILDLMTHEYSNGDREGHDTILGTTTELVAEVREILDKQV